MKNNPNTKIKAGKENKNHVPFSIIQTPINLSTNTTPEETYDNLTEERFTFENNHIYDRLTDKYYDFEETCTLLNHMEHQYATLYVEYNCHLMAKGKNK